MPKIKLIISISIFSILLGITSAIKNQTRILEKNIYKIDKKIAILEKDLYETELDYFYLSSPNILSLRIKELALVEYTPMDLSRIYFSHQDLNSSSEYLAKSLKLNPKFKIALDFQKKHQLWRGIIL